ncbi:MAG TPA: hypothetical protein VK604_15010 [Bryobacteraceae bacterium]|nr:hypothetical protein [Bryobacteraceae bacterium]
MGRVSLVHTIIVVNIGSELHNQLRTRDCTVHASLMEYLTLAQDRSHADHYTRQPDNSWLLREIEAAGSISLKCIAAELPLDRIYEKMQCATS